MRDAYMAPHLLAQYYLPITRHTLAASRIVAALRYAPRPCLASCYSSTLRRCDPQPSWPLHSQEYLRVKAESKVRPHLGVAAVGQALLAPFVGREVQERRRDGAQDRAADAQVDVARALHA